MDYTGVEEEKLLKDLPLTWSVPVPGETCKMIELMRSDPEFMEVESNVCKTGFKQPLEIVSVSELLSDCVRYSVCLQQQ